MRCPDCDSAVAGVMETRFDGARVRRRRKCKACGLLFTTSESVDEFYTPLPDPRWRGIRYNGRRTPATRQATL